MLRFHAEQGRPAPSTEPERGTDRGLRRLLASRRAGYSLPQAFYVDDEVYQIDLERIFRRTWLFAGHACQLKHAGDYITCDIDTDSIIIVRGRDGQLRALHNVCRHRGARICSLSAGRCRSLVCPYHQWTYDLDGSLLATPHLAASPGISSLRLGEAHVFETAGLVFISLADMPAATDEMSRHVESVLAPHRLERAKVAHVVTKDIEANWKLVMENQRECYHCPVSHPEYARAYYDAHLDDSSMSAELNARLADGKRRWAAYGIDPATVSFSSAYTGEWYRANRTPFRIGFVTESLDGRPVAPLMGDFVEADMGTARVGTYPNLWLHATSDHAAVVHLMPLGPTRTRTTTTWLVHEQAVDGFDYQLERLIEFTLIQSEQDWAILANQAAGVRSRRYEPGPYASRREANVERFVSWYIDHISIP